MPEPTIPDLADVLAAVNDLRATRGMEPLNALPKGKRHHARSCPVANALGGDVAVWPTGDDDGSKWHIVGEASHRPLPPVLAQFAERFDAGYYYQELVA
jgi:hypothetical protein